jgi:deoxyribose-phosphate aldolase
MAITDICVTDKKALWKYVDHTLLKAAAAWEDIRALCDEAVQYGAASVCVPPTFVSRIHDAYGPSLTICTVIGFPLGYHTAAAKIAETREAAADGAGEVDMVVNLGDVKAGDFAKVTGEIAAVKEAAGGNLLKVIVETCYLTEPEKITLCGCVTQAGADYIKTSTGFGSAGAALEDVRLFKNHIGPGVKIKAAGGISTLEEFRAFIEAGCSRIGTSRGVQILG